MNLAVRFAWCAALLSTAVGGSMGQGEEPEAAFDRALRSSLASVAFTGEMPLSARAVHAEVPGIGGGFLLEGRSALPSRSFLQVTLFYGHRSIAGRRVMVATDGAFDLRLGPYGERRIFEGLYRFLVSYQPHRQPASLRRADGFLEEPLEVAVEIPVGSPEGAAAERDERRRVYRDLLQRLEKLDRELESEVVLAQERRKYTVGSRRDFEERAWRLWADGWQERLESEVEVPIRTFRDSEALAVPMLEAAQTMLGLVRWHRELARARSRRVYAGFGRAPAPQDTVEEGGALVEPATIRSHILENRKKMADILVLEGREE